MKSILQEAEEIVNKDRQKQYGDPVFCFVTAAKIASEFCNRPISSKDIIKIQIALKITRESFQHKRDNLVDICGYAELLSRLEE